MLLLDELREAWRGESREHRIAFVIIGAIGVALRLVYLAQPMRYDESVTYMYFVKQPWSDALSLYTYPNNHLFHTLLVKMSVTLFGNVPWAIRLPAFLGGVLAMPATYAVARSIYGSRAALMAAAIVASSGVLVLYSTNARGYSLLVLAFLLLVLVAIRILRGAPSSAWVLFAVIAAVGLWTVPVMVYPLGTVSLWIALSLLIERRAAELRRLAIALGVTAGLTLLAYAPVISREGLVAITYNKFVVPSLWPDFFADLPATIGEAMMSWTLGVPPIFSLALALCALVALRRHAALSQFRIGIPLAAFVGSAWLLVVNHRAPFPRVWLWLLPIVAALAGAGIVYLLDRWPRVRDLLADSDPALPVALAVATAISLMLSRAVLVTRDTGTYDDAEQAAAILRPVLQPGDRVVVALPSNGPLEYYLDRVGVRPEHLTLPEQDARRVILVVDAGEGQTLGALVRASAVKDTMQFVPLAVLAKLPRSTLFMYQRRNAPSK